MSTLLVILCSSAFLGETSFQANLAPSLRILEVGSIDWSDTRLIGAGLPEMRSLPIALHSRDGRCYHAASFTLDRFVNRLVFLEIIAVRPCR